MRTEIINAVLDLEGLVVLGVSFDDHSVEAVVESRFGSAICPDCGGLAAEPKERPQVIVRDLSIWGRATVLVWRKRRWRCRYCSKTWTESHPQIPPRARMTKRFRAHLAARAMGYNFSRVAADEGVSYDTVARAHRRNAELLEAHLSRPPPRVLLIDEASFRKGRVFNTVISDHEARYVMDVVPGRDGWALLHWLAGLDEQTREGIEFAVMDMHRPFHEAVAAALPGVRRVADKFHVIRRVNHALDQVRARGQRGSRRPAAQEIFRSRFRLLKAKERLTEQERERLEELFVPAPDLRIAWILKEGVRDFYAQPDEHRGAVALQDWQAAALASGLRPFRGVAGTLRRWEPEILAYFSERLTNAGAEGVTNKIKVIKRQAYGLRSFDNYRERILVQCGQPKPRTNPRLIA